MAGEDEHSVSYGQTSPSGSVNGGPANGPGDVQAIPLMNGSADRFEPEDLNVADAAIRSPDPDGFSVMLDGLGDAPVAGVGNGGGGA